jgi:hypothetical protein
MTILSLAGGLGNQLFQYAIGLHTNGPIEIEWKLGFASENSQKKPELLTFTMPAEVSINKRRSPTRFEIRIHHWLLAFGASRHKIPRVIKRILELISAILLRAYFGKMVLPNIPSNLGYDPSFNPLQGGLIVGYFHSFKWLEDERIKASLQNLTIRNPSEGLLSLVAEADEKSILLVHLRLGDYEKETNLGILSTEYYSKALKEAWQSKKFNEIWVFTNDLVKSKEIYPSEWIRHSRWITEVDQSAAETLELMRHARGYILGNSTFSWWAAALSKTANPLVIAPSPWFVKSEEPHQLIPPNWKRVPSTFLNSENG